MKLPVKPIVDIAKKNGPKLVKKYGPALVSAIPEKTSLLKTPSHHRQQRYTTHSTETLQHLDSFNREELINLELEVEEYLDQIEEERTTKKTPVNPRLNRWMDNWKNIHRQVSSKRKNRDYIEYVKIYNNPEYQSDHFTGFEGHIRRYKELIASGDQDGVVGFITEQTGKSEKEVHKVIF